MIDIEEILQIHDILIENYGGTSGIRDLPGLDSAIHRPFATFDNNDLYPTPVDKAAAILESILINHPFVDGNKRTGYVLMRLILMNYNLDIRANEDDKYQLVINVASGFFKIDEIKAWIDSYLIKI